MGRSDHKADITISVFYGSIDIYATKEREPTIDDFDISTVDSSLQDFLVIVRHIIYICIYIEIEYFFPSMNMNKKFLIVF